MGSGVLAELLRLWNRQKSLFPVPRGERGTYTAGACTFGGFLTRFNVHSLPVWGRSSGWSQPGGRGRGLCVRKVPGGPYHRAQGGVVSRGPAASRLGAGGRGRGIPKLALRTLVGRRAANARSSSQPAPKLFPRPLDRVEGPGNRGQPESAAAPSPAPLPSAQAPRSSALTSSLGGFSWVFPNSPMTNWTPLTLPDFPLPAPRQVTGSRLGGAARKGIQTPGEGRGGSWGSTHARCAGAGVELGGVYNPVTPLRKLRAPK